jgi:DUF917 family protein
VVWSIDVDSLPDLERGASLLGSGGGGHTFLFRMLAERALAAHGAVTVIDSDEAPAEAVVIHVGLVGAVTAFAEKPMAGDEFSRAFQSLAPSAGTRLVAGYEGAAANAFTGILVAAEMGSPLLDVDGMGRALPRLDQTTYAAAGLPMSPFTLVDTTGNIACFDTGASSEAERLLRANTVLMGGWAAFAGYRLSVGQACERGVHGSLRRAIELGAAFRLRADSDLPTVLASTGGRHLASGRIVEVEWRRDATFGRGTATLRIPEDERRLRIEMQSEFLLVIDDGVPVASTPDVICLLDQRTMLPFQAEGVFAGAEVHVVAFDAPARWLEPDALALVSPRAFGYAVDYVSPR